jgi:hypothetical protein
MKLELKHLAGYLPYGLKYKNNYFEDKRIIELTPFLLSFHSVDFNKIKPILYPLSDLAKKIEVNGEKFVPIIKLNLDYDWSDNISIYDFSTITGLNMEDIYFVTDSLLEWHFDIYGLIEAGLAIDINTLKNDN